MNVKRLDLFGFDRLNPTHNSFGIMAPAQTNSTRLGDVACQIEAYPVSKVEIALTSGINIRNLAQLQPELMFEAHTKACTVLLRLRCLVRTIAPAKAAMLCGFRVYRYR